MHKYIHTYCNLMYMDFPIIVIEREYACYIDYGYRYIMSVYTCF